MPIISKVVNDEHSPRRLTGTGGLDRSLIITGQSISSRALPAYGLLKGPYRYASVLTITDNCE